MTKQLLPYLLTVLMSILGLNAFAYDIAVKNADGVTIYYDWNNDKTELEVSSSGWGCYSGNVVIPEFVEYEGKIYSVTYIGPYAFKECSLTSITIPSSIRGIAGDAFSDFSVTSVHITDLSAWCKMSFAIIDSDNISNPLYYAPHLFLNGKEIKDLEIPDGVTSIGSGAFFCCIAITSVTIPNSVTSIGSGAFDGTTWYNNQPEGLVYAGKFAYRYKGKMPDNTKIFLKDGTQRIADNAFSGCSGLTSIAIPNSVTSIGNSAFSGCSGLTSIAIPNSVTSIGSSAFSGCSGLTSITIPNSVTSIGSSAFSGCSGLTSVTIPNNVTSIGDDVFSGCSGLTSIKVESGNQKYDSRNNCNAIIETTSNTLIIGCKNSIIPNSVTSIGGRAFIGCSGLTSVTIPNSVTSIGSYAFWNCSGLTSVNIPNSVTSIGNDAFSGCSGLTSVTIPNSVTSIGGFAFSGCSGLTSITIPNSVTSIGAGAFGHCSGLTSIIIPNKVTSIGGRAFEYCSGLTSITIPNSVTSIGTFTFYNCSGLTSVTIPNSVTSIGDDAFGYCSSLTSITIPNSVTSIGGHAFYGTAWYDNQPDGLGYAGKVAYKYKGEMPANTHITIKDGTLGIAAYAFYGHSGLTSLTIPNSVTSIGGNAFYGCKGLTTITSEIEKPFEIDSWIFSDDTYNVAELIVPYGTKAAYQNKEGWNKFTMITEAPDKDAVAFTIDGIAYEGSKSEKTVAVKAVDTTQTSIEIPASVSYDGITFQVSGITDSVFDGSSMAALIWDVEAALPNTAFSNASIGSNFLLYVKSSSYAPSSVKNVVVDGTAQTIVLSDDGGQFYCPQAFMARRISYSHNYSMETGKGSTMGWESIALPFDVQRIIHGTQGEIVPFAAYSSGSNQKPFWLAYMSASGFKRTADIKANEAYIIAMPNNSSYQDNYILAGDVTFSAENVTVPQTPTFNGTFLPAFSFVAKSSSVYVLNVNNRNVKYSGSEKPGSIFIRDLRDVRPFEAYLTGNFTRGIVEISFDNGTTDILDVLLSTDDYQEMTIYTLSGQQVIRATQRDFDSVWQQLPKGVYIVNGKKLIK